MSVMQYTYFIVDSTGHVKIGTTANLYERIAALQTGHPHKLQCIGVCDYEENFLHHKFRQFKVRGEWFVLSDELSGWITEHCQSAPPKTLHPKFDGSSGRTNEAGYVKDEDLHRTYFRYKLTPRQE